MDTKNPGNDSRQGVPDRGKESSHPPGEPPADRKANVPLPDPGVEHLPDNPTRTTPTR